MNHWLFKSEAETWSWDDQVARGDAGQEWDGVRNFQARNQEAMREQVRQAFEANPALANIEALARSNMEWFENAIRMFAPFATSVGAPKANATGKPPRKDVELDELKEQLAAMQAQLAKLAKNS